MLKRKRRVSRRTEAAAAAEAAASAEADEDEDEPAADGEIELSEEGAAVQPAASEDNQVGSPSEDEGR